MARKCAYCDSSKDLTKDHVWPKCFLDRQGRTAAHFSVRAQQVHGSDYVVNDVCADCNGRLLSPLDAYFCALYDDYFVHVHGFDATVTFRCEYDLLVRALLKIAYNSARNAGSDVTPLRPIRDFVLGAAPRPRQLALYLEIVSPSIVSDTETTSGARAVLPQMYRSALTQLLVEGAEALHTRIVAINSYYFHLIVPSTIISNASFDQLATKLGEVIEGTVRLLPDVSEVTLNSSPQDGLRSIAPHLQQNSEQYKAFFARRRKSP